MLPTQLGLKGTEEVKQLEEELNMLYVTSDGRFGTASIKKEGRYEEKREIVAKLTELLSKRSK